MAGRLRLLAAVSVLIAVLVAAGCSAGGNKQTGGPMPGMENGAMKNGGMAEGGDKGAMQMGKGDRGGMQDMQMGDEAGQEEEYKPPTPEQLARVTRTVEISLNDQFKIQPKDVKVKKGEVVKFVVRNVGKLPHDWMADGIKEVATGEFPGGEERVIVWEADRTGTHTTYCMVPGHRAAGMVGTLSVTE